MINKTNQDRKLLIGTIPGIECRNPYVRLFYNALIPFDIEASTVPVLEPNWMKTHAKQFDGIHLHWPEQSWPGFSSELSNKLVAMGVPGSWRLSRWLATKDSLRRARQVIEALNIAKAAGVFVIWTFHNIEPHEKSHNANRKGYEWLANCSDLVIAHDAIAACAFSQRYPDAVEPLIMPHGNYDDAFPPPRPRDLVIKELGLNPTLPMFLCIGRIRAYKGFPEAAEAIKSLNGTVQLTIAGAPDEQRSVHHLRDLSIHYPYIKLIDEFIDDQRFSDLINASTGVLLPYHSITGSGALLSALTLGKGVITTDLPYFTEILRLEPEAGIIVHATDPVSIVRGVQEYLDIPQYKRDHAALRLASHFAWSKLIPPVANRIRSLAKEHQRR